MRTAAWRGESARRANEQSGKRRPRSQRRSEYRSAGAALVEAEGGDEGLPRECDAWLDFITTFDEMLRRDVKGGTYDIGVPQDLWDYWMQVAKGESQDYDILGIRKIDD